MREILFRGKRKDNGEWVKGYLADDDLIVNWDRLKEPYGYNDYTVYSETVGEFTGLTDKNGKKIFEGDIVKLGTGEIRFVFLWRYEFSTHELW